MATDRSVAFWQDSIKNGQRFQIKYGDSPSWRRYKQYYRHQFDRGTLPVNLIFSIMRSVVAQTYFKNPSISVTPTRPGLVNLLHAKLVERVDKWLLRELFTKYEIKAMIQDCFLCGTASGFNGYDSEYGWDPKAAESNGMASLSQFDKRGYRIEYNSFINPGMPWFLRARPEDVVFPWGTANQRNAEWVALRVLRPLEDLKLDRKYTVPKDVQGTYTPQRTGPEGQLDGETAEFFSRMQAQQQWVELWQVHDAKTGKVFVLTMKDTEFFRNDDDLMQIEGLPVEVLTFNPDPDYIYGIPDARIIEPQLLELNEIRTQLMKHRRVDIVKALIKKGSIEPEAIDKMLDPDVKAIVEVEADQQISNAVMLMQGVPGAAYQNLAYVAELVRQDVRETVGFSRNQVGEFQGKSHVTASEVNSVMQRSDIRVDERRDAVVDLLTNIVRKFNQTIFKHWTVPVVRDIVGPDGAKWWLKFTGPEIKAEYNLRIDPTTAAPQDPQSKKQEAIEMAKAWAEMNMGAVKAGQPVPAEIQRYFFANYDGIDVEKLLSEQNMKPPMGNPTAAMPPEVAAAVMQKQMGGGGR